MAWQGQAQAWQSEKQAWEGERQAFHRRVEELETTRRNLEHTVAVYQRCLFGSRSEKIDPRELVARIAQAAAEAGEQMAGEKRPGDPPADPEEEQTEAPAAPPGTPGGQAAEGPAGRPQE